jgi:hypothetical protein
MFDEETGSETTRHMNAGFGIFRRVQQFGALSRFLSALAAALPLSSLLFLSL